MAENSTPSTPDAAPITGGGPDSSPATGVDPDPDPVAGPTAALNPSLTASADRGPDTTPTAAVDPHPDGNSTDSRDPGADAAAITSVGGSNPDASSAGGEDPSPDASPTGGVGPHPDGNPAGGGDSGAELGRLRWTTPEPGRLLGRGHTAGDFLEAYEWRVLERRPGYLRVEAGLPAHVRNPRGQLFGGFTPTYVDLVALFTVRVGTDDADGMPRSWLATTQMRLDYFEPITGPRFVIESELEKKRGRTNFVLTRFFQEETLAVLAATTIREVPMDRPLGDA